MAFGANGLMMQIDSFTEFRTVFLKFYHVKVIMMINLTPASTEAGSMCTVRVKTGYDIIGDLEMAIS